MSIDPRLAERRKVVAEDRAKRTLRRLLKFLSLVGMAGLVVWFLLSPYLSAAVVDVQGASMAEVEAILAEHSVVVGRPLILIKPGRVVEALEEDPWVAHATVNRDWPNRVTVTVGERAPRAWVETAEGWARHDEEGVAVPSSTEPDKSLGWIHLPGISRDAGPGSPVLRGSIEFLMSLPEELAQNTAIRVEADELWAVVDGWQVRLGRADEMREKALSLVTLLETNLDQGAMIVLIAPTHPSVLPPPGADPDAGEDGDGEGE